jgi:hypothetical protein
MNSSNKVKTTESWLPIWFRKSRGAQLATKTIDDCQPHLFEGERDLIVGEMSRATSYLEFGTGGSTLLAAECGIRRIVSVDSDQDWVRKIDERIKSRSKVDVELIHCDIGKTGEWGYPINREKVANWPQYFVQPWHRFLSRNEAPDLIYVDGRFRVACVLYSLLNLQFQDRAPSGKSARIMIHDFLDRPHYGKITKYASVVASMNTLVVVEQKSDISQSQLLEDILSFEFDLR